MEEENFKMTNFSPQGHEPIKSKAMNLRDIVDFGLRYQNGLALA